MLKENKQHPCSVGTCQTTRNPVTSNPDHFFARRSVGGWRAQGSARWVTSACRLRALCLCDKLAGQPETGWSWKATCRAVDCQPWRLDFPSCGLSRWLARAPSHGDLIPRGRSERCGTSGGLGFAVTQHHCHCILRVTVHRKARPSQRVDGQAHFLVPGWRQRK